MYKAAVRHMIRTNIGKLNAGDYQPALAMFAPDGTLAFPGDNSWARQFGRLPAGRASVPTHRGRAQIEQFLFRYVGCGIQMEIEDILVNGPPWNTRAAAVVHHGVLDADGHEIYANRAVLYVQARWGKIQRQEDYEDTERVARFDEFLLQQESVS